MSLKYLSKLFLFSHKYRSRLLKFPNIVLNTQLRIFSHSKPPVRVEAFSNENRKIRTINETENISSFLRKNHEKYDVVKIEDIDLTEETNFKSLVLLKDLVDRSRNGSSEEEPEINIIPTELTNCIESECSSYNLNDIFKYIILTSKLRNEKNKRTLIRYLNDELKVRVLSKKEHLKILCISLVLLGKIYFSFDFFYTKKKLLRFTRKIRSLTLEQVVVLFYLMRKLPTEHLREFKFNTETHLLEILPKFNFNELIIVSRGILNSKMSFSRKSLPAAFAKKLIEEIENPHALPIFWVFKVIGSSAHLLKHDIIADFQEKIIPHAGKYEGKDLICLAITGADISYVNLSLWEILANNFKKNIKNYSLEDIEKMVHMTVICNIQDEELLKMSIEEFQNSEFLLSSYNALISFVYDLIHHQIYPEKLLSLVLSEDFRLKYNPESFSVISRQKYCFINSFIKFRKPESNFEFLENKTELKLYKAINIYPDHSPNDFTCYKALKQIMFSLEDIYGEKFVFLTSFQPHFRKGIVMRFDKNLEAQPIPEEFLLSNENYKRALNDDHIWLFIKVVRSCHYKQGTDILNLKTQTEFREMEAFGYAPVLILHDLWVRRKISLDSEDYLKDVMKNKVQEVINKQRGTI